MDDYILTIKVKSMANMSNMYKLYKKQIRIPYAIG